VVIQNYIQIVGLLVSWPVIACKLCTKVKYRGVGWGVGELFRMLQ